MKPAHVEPRPGEVKRLIADTTQARKLLGWQAEYNIGDGLKRFIDWYKNYKSEEWSKPG